MKPMIDIHELMLTKTFEALTAEEQTAVLAEMTADEYTEQRAVLLAFGDMTEAEQLPEPDAAILNSLRARHDELHRKPSGLENFISLLTRPIPAYQLVIAPAVLVIAFLFFWPTENNDSPQRTADSSIISDTIEVIKEFPQRIERVVYVDRLATAEVVDVLAEQPTASEPVAQAIPDRDAVKKSYGNSGLDADVLARLEAIAYREGI